MEPQLLSSVPVWTQKHLRCVTRKPVFGVSNQIRHKLSCTATKDDMRLEILDVGCRGIVVSMK